ncbi:MAG: RHS repeat-associated core domain-containing protein [Candidatus Brocadiia bacterium]
MERYRYDAYGTATVLDADGSADSDGHSDVENPYAFTARRLDAETDLMYYRNRQYSVTLGRFISRDPEGYADSRNLYQYARGAPTGCTDALGLKVEHFEGTTQWYAIMAYPADVDQQDNLWRCCGTAMAVECICARCSWTVDNYYHAGHEWFKTRAEASWQYRSVTKPLAQQDYRTVHKANLLGATIVQHTAPTHVSVTVERTRRSGPPDVERSLRQRSFRREWWWSGKFSTGDIHSGSHTARQILNDYCRPACAGLNAQEE